MTSEKKQGQSDMEPPTRVTRIPLHEDPENTGKRIAKLCDIEYASKYTLAASFTLQSELVLIFQRHMK